MAEVPEALIGRKRLSELTWVTDEQSDPVEIGGRLLEDTRAWLERAERRSSKSEVAQSLARWNDVSPSRA
jgi:hypothetical protein